MDLIFDTNTLSAFADGDTTLLKNLENVSQIYLPVVVLGEYRYGVSMSKYRKNYEYWLDSSLNDFTILPVLDTTTKHYSLICKKLKLAGTPIPTNDIWISALAQEHQLPIITRDSHFKKVEKLNVLSW